MLKFIGESFEKLVTVVIWLCLILSTVSGGVFGCTIGYGIGYVEGAVVGATFGVLVGLVLGFIILVIVFGQIVVLLNIRESLQNIEKSHLKIASKEFTPTHRAKPLTPSATGVQLRKEPNASIEHFRIVPTNEEVQHIGTGSDIVFNNEKGAWFEVVTKDGTCGWCFSGSLEKI